MQEWSQKTFGQKRHHIKFLIKKLNYLKAFSPGDSKGIKEVENQIERLLRDEEIYWRQRSKALWLQNRDRNTKFFHGKASDRRRRNLIEGILDQNNFWREDTQEIEHEVCRYFHELFTSSKPLDSWLESSLRWLNKRVDDEMNRMLC